jgi:excisionase family DNA binding protein
MPEEVLTAQQVADELKAHIGRVYKWIQDGELAATDLGTPARHNYRINRSDFENFKQRRRMYPRHSDEEDS